MDEEKIVKTLSKARRLLVEKELTKYGNEPCGILAEPAAKSIERHNQIGTAVTILASAMLIAEAIEKLRLAVEEVAARIAMAKEIQKREGGEQ